MPDEANSQDTVTVTGDSGQSGPITPTAPETTLPTPPSSVEVRKRLRDATQQPKPRKKRMRKTQEQRDIAELVEPPLRIIDRKTRWMVLLTGSNGQHAEIIKEAYDGKVEPDSFEWRNARQKIYDNVKAYKYKVIDRAIAHVQAIKKIEEAKDSLFPVLDEPGHLHKEFIRRFNKENLFEVFFYMDGYIDVEGSSDLGKYYLQNIYANLCVRAKLLVDYMEKNPGASCLDERKKVSDFYLRMSNKKEFDEVDKSCFVETFDKSLREKTSKRFKPNMLADDDPDYVLSAPPPSKSVATNASMF